MRCSWEYNVWPLIKKKEIFAKRYLLVTLGIKGLKPLHFPMEILKNKKINEWHLPSSTIILSLQRAVEH